MSLAIRVDVRDFISAMSEYGRYSRKDSAVICNSKLRDVMARATQFAPMTDKARKVAYVSNPPAFVTYLASRLHGKGFKRSQRTAIWQRWYKAPSGRGFMKSGFAKSARAMRRESDPDNKSAAPEPKRDAKLTRSKGWAKSAAHSWISHAYVKASWLAHLDPRDAPLKQDIVDSALRQGLSFVAADMRVYVARKLARSAAKVSAK